jgi:hypothetical protein
MGTNYYLHQKPDCECCGRAYEPLHIGKSSVGWVFALHVIPEDGIRTLDDWRRLWSAPGSYIRDEYGNRLPPDEMLRRITERQNPRGWDDGPRWACYGSETESHEVNHSQRGPNGLLRRGIGRYCIGHGDGTWDYMVGEFS